MFLVIAIIVIAYILAMVFVPGEALNIIGFAVIATLVISLINMPWHK